METRTEKQEEILDAALALIAERGFHDSPISAIAKRAGVGAGTIYRYYETKDDLIKDLYVREKKKVVAEILHGCSDKLSVKENLRRMWHNRLASRTMDPCSYHFMEQFYDSPYLAAVSPEERRELAGEYMAYFERGIREGVLADLSFPVMNAVVHGMVSSLTMSIMQGDLELTDELEEESFEVCWRAIAKPR